MNQKAILIDGNSLTYRAYYALPSMNNGKGFFTNAIYGYLAMLAKLIEDEKPSHICVVFDVKGKTFRNDIYSQYKGTRKPMPIELSEQLPVLKELLSLINIKIVEKSGYEADDILGTLSNNLDINKIIVSGDRDVLQLVSDTTIVYLTKRGVSEIVRYDLDKLAQEGFTPQQIIEYKALAGDASDNIPGCPGIGEITAKNLLKTYKSVDNILENSSTIKGRIGEALRDNTDLIQISKKLATIIKDVPVNINLTDIVFDYTYNSSFFELMDRLAIKSLQTKYRNLLISDNEKPQPFIDIRANNKELDSDATILDSKKDILDSSFFIPRNIYNFDFSDTIVKTINDFKYLEDILSSNFSVFYFHMNDDEFYFCTSKNKLYSIDFKKNLFEEGLDYTEVMLFFKKVFENSNITKITFDVKLIKHKLKLFNVDFLPPYEDIRLREYLLRSHISNRFPKDLLGSNLADKFFPLCYMDVFEKQKNELTYLNLQKLYCDIELPLIEVLYDMEITGFLIDLNVLNELSIRYSIELEALSEKIYLETGKVFNINSPKQMGEILFEHLGIEPLGKTKTGNYSVDIEVLEEIDHPIASLIIRYRKIKKLLSTYIDGFKVLIDKKTHRIHTTFQQCITATGRLSSTDPNLQNIPVRRDEGKEIRRMLIPSIGNVLITADYSQIELRLLAEFSKDDLLIESYKKGEDIHLTTAANIFGIKKNEVSSDMRRAAKAINFGIIYGISPFGLSKNIGATIKEAKEYVDRYFYAHPQVKKYMDSNSEFALNNHYIRSHSGRIRFFPEFSSLNSNEKRFAMRAAMNMPLQGSSSDIIKIAMLNIYNEIKKMNLKTKIILQVHDELILDVPPNEVNIIRSLLERLMVNAVALSAPLFIEIKSGENWSDAS